VTQACVHEAMTHTKPGTLSS